MTISNRPMNLNNSWYLLKHENNSAIVMQKKVVKLGNRVD